MQGGLKLLSRGGRSECGGEAERGQKGMGGVFQERKESLWEAHLK